MADVAIDPFEVSSALGRLRTALQVPVHEQSWEQVQDTAEVAAFLRLLVEKHRLGTETSNEVTALLLKTDIRMANIVDEGQAAGTIATPGDSEAQGVASGDVLTLEALGITAPRLSEARRIAAMYGYDGVDAELEAANGEGRLFSRRAVLNAAKERARRNPAAPAPVVKHDPTATERQRRHRLYERLRPEEPLPSVVSHREYAWSLVERLNAGEQISVAELVEAIKRIAWWPDA